MLTADTAHTLQRARLGATLLVMLLLSGVTGAAVEVAERDAINPGLGGAPAAVSLTTPEAAWRSFLEAAEAGRLGDAAHCLDLTDVLEEEQAKVGERVAEQLYRILDEVGAAAKPAVADAEAQPGAEMADNVFVAARFTSGEVNGEVWLRRTLDLRNEQLQWLVSRRTVSEVQQWYQKVVEGTEMQATELNLGLGAAPDEVGRETPRDTVVGFLVAGRDGRFDLAAHYLDLSALPAATQAETGARLARRFKIVLDQTFWFDPDAISNDPAGRPDADLEPDQERLGSVEADGRSFPLLLRRHLLEDGSYVWTFGASTVGAIGPLYEVYGYGRLGDVLPAVFFIPGPLEVKVWQWCALVVLLFVGWSLARLVTPRVVSGLKRASSQTDAEWDDSLVAAVSGPLRLAIIAGFLFLAVPWLRLSEPAMLRLAAYGKVAAIIIIGWLVSQWVNLAASLLERSAVAEHNQVARSFVPIFSRIIKVAVWAVVAVLALDTAGFRVMGLVAGLGIGGLAFAFAAQKSIENLFGAFAIAADRPFEVGNFVTLGGVSGTIEEVGLRSTRIRTQARTQITIPNGKVMSETTENFSLRDRIQFTTTLGLLYSSTAAQLEYVIDEIKKVLLAHPMVFKDVVRVRLDSLGDSAININVLSWLTTTDFNEFTALKEELYFEFIKIVEQAGTGFAFPSRTVYTTQEAGIDAERAQEVATIVAARRDQGDLWIPEAPAAE